jgi:hypothetical protein
VWWRLGSWDNLRFRPQLSFHLMLNVGRFATGGRINKHFRDQINEPERSESDIRSDVLSFVSIDQKISCPLILLAL